MKLYEQNVLIAYLMELRDQMRKQAKQLYDKAEEVQKWINILFQKREDK